MKKILLFFALILVGIQIIPLDKKNPPVNKSKDFMTIVKPPSNIEKMLRKSCYDCHSNETVYPWYSNIAPVSWLIAEHVRTGRSHLNFSLWNDYKEAKKYVKIKECIEMIKSGEMPMKGYVLFHDNADLILTEKNELIDWFNSMLGKEYNN